MLKKGDVLTEQEYSNHKPKVVEKFEYMLKHGEIHPDHKTKKFAQRVLPKRWGDGGPSITATSLADDYVHYSEPRTLTVREWARLQTFPDWYVFKGPGQPEVVVVLATPLRATGAEMCPAIPRSVMRCQFCWQRL